VSRISGQKDNFNTEAQCHGEVFGYFYTDVENMVSHHLKSSIWLRLKAALGFIPWWTPPILM